LLLEQARTAARQIAQQDPDFATHPELHRRLKVWEKRLFAGVA
jgi:hypothetical protein